MLGQENEGKKKCRPVYLMLNALFGAITNINSCVVNILG
uniref:Uncharacterized protein n=1 Tax=Rhizophora mucronata TaxID=61149 RepID=A0A2P2QWS4_RHIMU